ncbi:hypothetical protein BST27_27030 [Mycobacterium intermedium]|uniref:Uncharacterized protein n=1 Tax=Mycobacterium intermedium TaxID=28445 RepID=A0A1E3S8S2_MYCIE|nr:hypothetical protein [Mycobacterium intermedium]MCV6965064.1 hypothetical protein [Mycobacterium intermedium]ODQ98022.1 hypothetical protein BHQ20_23850 [Mycobacterium intermedium]OPE46207.1 hypothetical protein BV508_26825 [Mycobacterium intermedium]ORA95221.1 hypothetical protein BST27_27030 [Mycobacterium intermedium]
MVAALLAGPGLVACGGSTSNGGTLVVQQGGHEVRRFVLPQLRDLPQVEVATPQSHGARVQKGPTVRSILAAAGTTGVDLVRVEGRDPAQTLTAAELTDQLILNVTKRNTLKLTGTQLARERWVRDVTALVVNP